MTVRELAKRYVKRVMRQSPSHPSLLEQKIALERAYKTGYLAAQKKERQECADRAFSRYVDDLRGL